MERRKFIKLGAATGTVAMANAWCPRANTTRSMANGGMKSRQRPGNVK